MLNLNSARLREETAHSTNGSGTIISDTLKRRAESVINNKAIDTGTRLVIRYGLETNDPLLGDLMRRVDAGETIIDNIDPQSPATDNDDLDEDIEVKEKIEALAVIICRPGDDPERKSAALLVLMSTLQSATNPKALTTAAKYVAFCRCAELNPYGMVDAQIAVLEDELLADHMFMA